MIELHCIYHLLQLWRYIAKYLQVSKLMPSSILLVTAPPPPEQPTGQVPGVVAREMGQIKKYLLFDFAKYMLFPALFTRWLRTSRLRIFKEKQRNLICQRVVGEE